MQPVCFEQHLDRYAEEGLLEIEVLIDLVIQQNAATGATRTLGRRVPNASSMVVGKIYTVAENAELYMIINGAHGIFLESGDQVEVMKTLNNARGTGFRIVRAKHPISSPNRFLAMKFMAVHEIIGRAILNAKLKKTKVKDSVYEVITKAIDTRTKKAK